MRDFEKWFSTLKPSLATYEYFTDYNKAYKLVDSYSEEIEILNKLVGSKNIEKEFLEIYKTKPYALRILPFLIAKHESVVQINDFSGFRTYNFEILNLSGEEYLKFAKKTGILDLLQYRIKDNLKDYLIGVEVGMDTNSRKNRTGKLMEELVEEYLCSAGLVKNIDYFSQMTKTNIQDKFGINLSSVFNKGKTEKKFDFVVYKNNIVYAIEVNFYNSSGSKLNETARSYKDISLEVKNIKRFKFVWITDGYGWLSARQNLEETFDVLEDVYNINDLNNNVLSDLFKK